MQEAEQERKEGLGPRQPSQTPEHPRGLKLAPAPGCVAAGRCPPPGLEIWAQTLPYKARWPRQHQLFSCLSVQLNGLFIAGHEYFTREGRRDAGPEVGPGAEAGASPLLLAW